MADRLRLRAGFAERSPHRFTTGFGSQYHPSAKGGGVHRVNAQSSFAPPFPLVWNNAETCSAQGWVRFNMTQNQQDEQYVETYFRIYF